MSAASNQMDCPKNSPREVQVRLPEGERIKLHPLTTPPKLHPR